MNAADAVREFVDAFNEEAIEALVATLTDDAEIVGKRGPVRGPDAVRDWATRNPSGELRQRLVLEHVTEYGEKAVAALRREWVWRDEGEVADDQRLYYVATMRDGLIARWEPFDRLGDALSAVGGNAG
jgi:ketosteroid isomerase-like protein